MTNYAMFTLDGNAAVNSIIEYHLDAEVDHNGLYDLVLGDLERLQTIAAFAEATDTAVREAVYQRCLELKFVPIFRTTRNKTVDAA
jgi:hypothetical protein